MVVQGHQYANGRGHLQQYPHQGCFAIARAIERADGIAAKGTPRNQTPDEQAGLKLIKNKTVRLK